MAPKTADTRFACNLTMAVRAKTTHSHKRYQNEDSATLSDSAAFSLSLFVRCDAHITA